MKKKLHIVLPMAISNTFKAGIKNISVEFQLFEYDYKKVFYYTSRLLGSDYFVMKSLEYDFNLKFAQAIKQMDRDDVLLVIAGFGLNQQNINYLKIFQGKSNLWFIDSASRYQRTLKDIHLYSNVYFHDGGDFENYDHQNKYWRPYGFNSNYYFEETIPKDIDVLFTGNLKAPEYETRLKTLKLILKHKLDEKFKIVAACTSQDKNLIEQLSNSKIEYTGRLEEKSYANYIKRSKVVVNILQDDGSKPINPLFFAIPACGVIQISLFKKYLQPWIKDNKLIVLSADLDTFINDLKSILENYKIRLKQNENNFNEQSHLRIVEEMFSK